MEKEEIVEKFTGQGHGSPELVREVSVRVGSHGPSANDRSASMVESQATVLDNATGLNEAGKNKESPFSKSRKTARSPVKAVKTTNKETFYSAWQQAEKEKMELQKMCQQMQQQIQELQLELAEIRKNEQAKHENQISNSKSQAIYYTDEEELERETGWIEHRRYKRKKRNTPGNSPQQDPQIPQNNTKKMRQRPPPIIIDKKENYEQVYNLLATNGIIVKSRLLASKEIKINLEEAEAYRGVTHLLNDKGICWHSFENKLDRPIRVIAKGISPSFGTEMILNDLYQRKYRIISVENILKKSVSENLKKNLKKTSSYRSTC